MTETEQASTAAAGSSSSEGGTAGIGSGVTAGAAHAPTASHSAPPAPAAQPTAGQVEGLEQTSGAVEYYPELGETCVYRDEHGHESAAIVTRVVSEDTEEVSLIVFPEQSHHRHVRAMPVERSHGSTPTVDAPGWYPTDT